MTIRSLTLSPEELSRIVKNQDGHIVDLKMSVEQLTVIVDKLTAVVEHLAETDANLLNSVTGLANIADAHRDRIHRLESTPRKRFFT